MDEATKRRYQSISCVLLYWNADIAEWELFRAGTKETCIETCRGLSHGEEKTCFRLFEVHDIYVCDEESSKPS